LLYPWRYHYFKFCGAPGSAKFSAPRGENRPILGRQEVAVLRDLRALWSGDQGQNIVEYAMMLAVILVVVIGTLRLVGGNANNVFSTVASNVQ
jgi:Flp pilus assembly pilin Flp